MFLDLQRNVSDSFSHLTTKKIQQNLDVWYVKRNTKTGHFACHDLHSVSVLCDKQTYLGDLLRCCVPWDFEWVI